MIFNPEFLTEANFIEDFKNQDRIILGGEQEPVTIMGKFFEKVFPNSTIIETESNCAEMVKYLSNTFLATKVSFANEMKLLSHKINIDIFEVIKLANTKPFGIFPFFPGPGMGGHCIPVDPFILSWFAKKKNFYSQTAWRA